MLNCDYVVAGECLCVVGDGSNPYTRHEVCQHRMVATFFCCRCILAHFHWKVQISFKKVSQVLPLERCLVLPGCRRGLQQNTSLAVKPVAGKTTTFGQIPNKKGEVLQHLLLKASPCCISF